MSAIQFNLLPDVKLDYVRTQQVRRRVTTVAVLASAVALSVFLIMVSLVYGVQKKQLSSAGKEVENTSSQLRNIPDVSKAVIVQNQLQALVQLHQNKHMSGRIFGYLAQLTPANLSISKLDMDLTTNAMDISGNADSQKTVNTFIDTLKATTFKVGDSAAKAAFPSVIESDFAINPGNVSYTLNLQFDPSLFANNVADSQGKTVTPQLSVPKTQTTPQSDIFQTQTGGGGQ